MCAPHQLEPAPPPLELPPENPDDEPESSELEDDVVSESNKLEELEPDDDELLHRDESDESTLISFGVS